MCPSQLAGTRKKTVAPKGGFSPDVPPDRSREGLPYAWLSQTRSGANSAVLSAATAPRFVRCSRSARSSRIQKDRPCVAITTSPCRVSTATSRTWTGGRLSDSGRQPAPPSRLTYTVVSVPRNRRSGSRGSWRIAHAYWSAGSPFVIDVQCAP